MSRGPAGDEVSRDRAKRDTALDAAVVSARLRELSGLADLRRELRLEIKVDSSSAGVTRRLRRLSALRALCLRLRSARAVSPL